MSDRVFNVSYSNTISEIEHAVEASRDEVRQNKLHFHVESDEYFCHLATLLGCFEETLAIEDEFSREVRALQSNALQAIRKDLLYLQKHFVVQARNTAS